MPLLRKGKKAKKRLNQPNVQVYMPYKKPTPKVVRKKKKFFVFSKKSSKSYRRGKFKVSSVLIYLFLSLLAFLLLYLSTLFVIRMREDDVEEYSEQYVIGLEGIPVYPGSEFIFASSIDEPSVANFISSGNSAYRLPNHKSFVDATEFYNEILPAKGWSFVLSVEVGSEEMKHGEYWVKDDTGLRIYSKFNDIWYELLTYEQASTGLRERVEREIERDLLLANQELQDLLPDFSWIIKVPKEYIISYSTSSFENLRSVEFKKLGSNERLVITPIGFIGTKVLDDFLRDYLDILNVDSEENWTITNTVLTYTEYGRALRGSISFGGKVHDVAVIPNSYDKVMYVLEHTVSGDSFFEYVMENLHPQGTKSD